MPRLCHDATATCPAFVADVPHASAALCNVAPLPPAPQAPQALAREASSEAAAEAPGAPGAPTTAAELEAAAAETRTRAGKRHDIVEHIKMSPDYLNYKAWRESCQVEDPSMPQTPDANDREISKRSWERIMMEWRFALKERAKDQGLQGAPGEESNSGQSDSQEAMECRQQSVADPAYLHAQELSSSAVSAYLPTQEGPAYLRIGESPAYLPVPKMPTDIPHVGMVHPGIHPGLEPRRVKSAPLPPTQQAPSVDPDAPGAPPGLEKVKSTPGRVQVLLQPAIAHLGCEASGDCRVIWTVDARRLSGKGRCRVLVSPPFVLCAGVPGTFRMMLHPSSAATNFKTARGRGSVHVKCESTDSELPDGIVHLRLSVGEGEGKQKAPGPIAQNFRESPTFRFPDDQEEWDFLAATIEETQHFVVSLEVLPSFSLRAGGLP